MSASPAELMAIEAAHRAAQAKLGISGARLALRDWQMVSGVKPTATSASWLARALRMIFGLRAKSRRLARAYYQLARALDTGYTLGLPEYSDDPAEVTLGGLREQYLQLLLDISSLETEEPEVGERDDDELFLEGELRHDDNSDADNSRTPLLDAVDMPSYIQELLDATDTSDNDTLIEIDEFDWSDDKATEELETFLEKELKSKAVEPLQTRTDTLAKRDDLDPAGFIAATEKQHSLSGSAGAGIVDQAGINAGRELINDTVSMDRRVKRVARGTSANPCAFCSMLASRGFVYAAGGGSTTKKRKTAAGNDGFFEDGETVRKFHPNCHCYPVVRWDTVSDVAAPGRSEYFAEMWPKVTGAYRGVDKLNAWRRWVNFQRAKELAASRESAKTPS